MSPEAYGKRSITGGPLSWDRGLDLVAVPPLPRPLAAALTILQTADSRLAEHLTAAGLGRVEPRPLVIEVGQGGALPVGRVRSANVLIAITP